MTTSKSVAVRAWTISILLLSDSSVAVPDFQQRIPNGANVQVDGMVIGPVGHDMSNPALLNPFGVDFKSAGLEWTVELCEKDSDGDGMSNGKELGDPDCVWKVGMLPAFQDNITHPGVFTALTTTISVGDDNETVTNESSNVTENKVVEEPEMLTLAPWLQAHIACMMLSWGIFLPVGALIAISFRGIGNSKALWFKLHMSVQVVGVLLSIVGTIIAFVNAAIHLNGAHQWIGTIIFGLGILQAIQGFLRPHKAAMGESETRVRKFWEFCHKGLGRGVLILAWANIFLGLKLVKNFYTDFPGNERVLTVCKSLFIVQICLCVILTAVSIFYRYDSGTNINKAKDEAEEEIDEETRRGDTSQHGSLEA